jgi:hypothetical protein
VQQIKKLVEEAVMEKIKSAPPSVLKAESGTQYTNEMNISGGVVSKGNYKAPKTSGIKIRGTGAATKGVMARGPMG